MNTKMQEIMKGWRILSRTDSYSGVAGEAVSVQLFKLLTNKKDTREPLDERLYNLNIQGACGVFHTPMSMVNH